MTTSMRYTDLQMRRKYSLLRWAVGTLGVVLGIVIIVAVVLILTTWEHEEIEEANGSIAIGAGVSAGVLCLLLVVAFCGIELARRKELKQAQRRMEEIEADIRQQTQPSAPPASLRGLNNNRSTTNSSSRPSLAPSSQPPPYEAVFHTASFWTNNNQGGGSSVQRHRESIVYQSSNEPPIFTVQLVNESNAMRMSVGDELFEIRLDDDRYVL